MDLAGDVVQELCDFLNISELPSTADFPHEFDALQTILTMVCHPSCRVFEFPNVSAILALTATVSLEGQGNT